MDANDPTKCLYGSGSSSLKLVLYRSSDGEGNPRKARVGPTYEDHNIDRHCRLVPDGAGNCIKTPL